MWHVCGLTRMLSFGKLSWVLQISLSTFIWWVVLCVFIRLVTLGDFKWWADVVMAGCIVCIHMVNYLDWFHMSAFIFKLPWVILYGVYIYTYICIVIHRQFHCITMWLNTQDASRCDQSQADLCQPDILPHTHQQSHCKWRNFNAYLSFFFCLHMCFNDYQVLVSLKELCIMQVATNNSFTRVLNPRSWEHMYMCVYIYSYIIYSYTLTYFGLLVMRALLLRLRIYWLHFLLRGKPSPTKLKCPGYDTNLDLVISWLYF